VLALLTGKLLIVDLANHNTFERILSFIAAGVIFLLASYLYSKFGSGFGADEKDCEPEAEVPRKGSAGEGNGIGDVVGGGGVDCSQAAGVEASLVSERIYVGSVGSGKELAVHLIIHFRLSISVASICGMLVHGSGRPIFLAYT
jgi:hypothetical protein